MKSFVVLIFLSFLLSSCVTIYKPDLVQSPLLKEKSDFNANAAVALSGAGLYNVQAAYAVSDHVGITANGMYHYRKTESDNSSTEKLNILYAGAGAGYFAPFSSGRGLFQCYGGIGFGGSQDKINTAPNPPEVTARYHDIFIQPGVALIRDNFEMAFDLRCRYVNLTNIHAYLYDEFEWWNTDFRYYSDTSFYFVNLEPTFTMKVGGEKIKGFLQAGLTVPTVHSDSYFLANTSSMMIIPLVKFSIGASITLGKRTGTKK
jgi:hypothetical protein